MLFVNAYLFHTFEVYEADDTGETTRSEKTMKIKTITVSHCIFKVWVVDYQTKQEHREPTDRTRNKINVFL